MLGFAGGRFVCDAEDALACVLACRVLEFGAEPADQAAFFFLGPFDAARPSFAPAALDTELRT